MSLQFTIEKMLFSDLKIVLLLLTQLKLLTNLFNSNKELELWIILFLVVPSTDKKSINLLFTTKILRLKPTNWMILTEPLKLSMKDLPTLEVTEELSLMLPIMFLFTETKELEFQLLMKSLFIKIFLSQLKFLKILMRMLLLTPEILMLKLDMNHLVPLLMKLCVDTATENRLHGD